MNQIKEKHPIAQLEFAIQKADLKLVKSIFNNKELSKDIDLSKTSGPLSLACAYGQLDIVKYLLTSNDISKNPDINSPNCMGFEMACKNGWLDIVKYLTSSSNLKNCIEIETIEDIGFSSCLESNCIDIIRHFIFDINIKRTEVINIHLQNYPNVEVENMFKIRDNHLKLEQEIIFNKVNSSNNNCKIKI